jgi:ketosteroid isomerase-like protein
MKFNHLLGMACCLTIPVLGNATATESEAAAVTATIQGFHAALSEGNSDAAARLLAPDAIILEGGEKETRKAYIEHHLQEDIKFARTVPSTRSKPDISIAGDVAWTTSTSITKGTHHGKALSLVGAELMVLSRTTSGWQIRAIHWSSRKVK